MISATIPRVNPLNIHLFIQILTKFSIWILYSREQIDKYLHGKMYSFLFWLHPFLKLEVFLHDCCTESILTAAISHHSPKFTNSLHLFSVNIFSFLEIGSFLTIYFSIFSKIYHKKILPRTFSTKTLSKSIFFFKDLPKWNFFLQLFTSIFWDQQFLTFSEFGFQNPTNFIFAFDKDLQKLKGNRPSKYKPN